MKKTYFTAKIIYFEYKMIAERVLSWLNIGKVKMNVSFGNFFNFLGNFIL